MSKDTSKAVSRVEHWVERWVVTRAALRELPRVALKVERRVGTMAAY